jgi:hypothetical protein
MALFKLAKDIQVGDVLMPGPPGSPNEIYGSVIELGPKQYDLMWVRSDAGRYLLFQEGQVQFFGNLLEDVAAVPVS